MNIQWDCEEEVDAGVDDKDVWLLLEQIKTTQGPRTTGLMLRPAGDGTYVRVGAVVVESEMGHLVWPDANVRKLVTIV